jgi:hypothetical protein
MLGWNGKTWKRVVRRDSVQSLASDHAGGFWAEAYREKVYRNKDVPSELSSKTSALTVLHWTPKGVSRAVLSTRPYFAGPFLDPYRGGAFAAVSPDPSIDNRPHGAVVYRY